MGALSVPVGMIIPFLESVRPPTQHTKLMLNLTNLSSFEIKEIVFEKTNRIVAFENAKRFNASSNEGNKVLW